MNADHESSTLERLKLPDPLASTLQSNVGSRAQTRHVQARSWVVVTARLDRSQRRKVVTRLAVPVLGAASLLAAVVFGPGLFTHPAHSVTADASPASAPSVQAVPKPRSPALGLIDGSEFVGLTGHDHGNAQSAAKSRATFEDGSTLTALTADAVLEPLAMTERDVILRLVSGSVDVAVTKGGSRKWTLETGTLSVEVVGTRFVVARSVERVSVTVTEGVVLVRSPKLEDGAKRLLAGESVSVASRDLAPRPAATSFDALMQKADAARQSGDLRSASAHFQQLIRAFPSDARTGVAAFQLALVTQQLGAPATHVVDAFELALTKARGQNLRQDCYWRLVLALEHAGQPDQAKGRAEQSLRDYPNGRYAKELRRRLAPTAPREPNQ